MSGHLLLSCTVPVKDLRSDSLKKVSGVTLTEPKEDFHPGAVIFCRINQCAKEVVSDSATEVFWRGNSNYRRTPINSTHPKKIFALVKKLMPLGLVLASYS